MIAIIQGGHGRRWWKVWIMCHQLTFPCQTGQAQLSFLTFSRFSNHDCNHPWGPWKKVIEGLNFAPAAHILPNRASAVSFLILPVQQSWLQSSRGVMEEGNRRFEKVWEGTHSICGIWWNLGVVNVHSAIIDVDSSALMKSFQQSSIMQSLQQ